MNRRRANRRPRHNSNRKGEGSNLGAALKVLVGVIVLGALGGLIFVQTERQNAKDPDTYCHRDGPSSVTIVLLDASDIIDEVQAERIKADIIGKALNSDQGTRFDVYVADTSDGKLSKPVFKMCNPGEPERFDSLYSDVKARREAFEGFFINQMESLLSDLLTVEEAPSSPIIESIRSAATASLSRLNDSTPIRLIIVSDMVQNSSLVRHRSSSADFSEFKKSSAWPRALVDLRGARIEVLYVVRSQYSGIQNRGHQLWWEDYFSAVNGHISAFDTI